MTGSVPTPDALRAMTSVELLKLRNKLKKSFQPEAGAKRLRIALTGSGNLSYFGIALEPFFIAAGFDPRLYVSPYGAYHCEICAEDSALVQSEPDIVIVIENWRDYAEYQPALTATKDETAAALDKVVSERTALLARLHERTGAPVYLSEIVTPNRRADGFFALNRPAGVTRFLREINRLTAERKPDAVRLIDLDDTAAAYGKNDWFDDSAWFLSKQPFSLSALTAAANAVSAPILNAFGVTRKCLALDLDGTLWGGVAGDDGPLGIRLDPNDAVGEAHRDFQRTVLSYRRRGVLLAVCSKNDEATAREVFEKNPYCLLKMNHFAAFYANWDSKVTNLKRIAADLNIGTDALVFFDDNPAEREWVRSALPEVAVIDVPADPAAYSAALDQARVFDWVSLTAEDISRAETFSANRSREALKAEALDYPSYLRSLEMRAVIRELRDSDAARFVQLFNKTNQFNLRTERYQNEDIERMRADEKTTLLTVELQDRFSQYGIISALILRESIADFPESEPEEKTLSIAGWVMSCRVFNRGLESFILRDLRERAAAIGARYLTAAFRPTAKNGYLADQLDPLGFQALRATGDETLYRYDVEARPEPETTIERGRELSAYDAGAINTIDNIG